MKRQHIFSLLLLLTMSVASFGQSIRVSAPSTVKSGENFRVEYTIDTQDVSDFRSGIQTTEGYEVIAGPYESRSSSYHMVNGHTSSSSTLKITYTLYALKEGDYTFPAAHATIAGKTVSAKPFSIKFSGKAASGGSAPKMHGEDNASSGNSSARISSNDLFIKVSTNKQRVKEQEAVLVTYKVYTLVELTQLEGKMPDLKGCHVQEVELPQQKSFHIENVGGRNYRCVTWSQYVVYPQTTGIVEISSITFKGIVVVQNKDVDPLEAFLNGGAGYTEVNRGIVAPAVKITVDELPDKPVGFSGGVGQMSIKASVDKNTVDAGNPVTLKVDISGNGNLKLLTFPEVNFTKDFGTYDPKSSDETRLTERGIEGKVSREYIVVPRNKGKYTIPAIEFTYYDTSSRGYKTLKTQSIDVVVKGDAPATSSSLDANANDIHGIMATNAGSPVSTSQLGKNSLVRFIIFFSVPFLLFLVLLLLFRQRAIANADIIGQKGKRANRVAGRRLKRARALMQSDKQHEFYEEVLHALWGYASDKMNIPTENLSRENVSNAFGERNIDDTTLQTFITALDECEYEQYAPGDKKGNMAKTYDAASKAIISIEEEMKRKSSRRGSRKSNGLGNNSGTSKATMMILTLALLFTSSSTFADEQGDSLYNAGEYQKSIESYLNATKDGGDARELYNLGCAYFRTGQIGKSILYFERARRFMPGNNDVEHNLNIARKKTVDKMTPADDFVVLQWLNNASSVLSLGAWGTLSIVAITVALILLLLLLFSSHDKVRRISSWACMLSALVCLVSLAMAIVTYARITTHNHCVVTVSETPLRQSPPKGSKAIRIIHEGATLKIVGEGKDCYNVQLPDGQAGWIDANALEII